MNEDNERAFQEFCHAQGRGDFDSESSDDVAFWRALWKAAQVRAYDASARVADEEARLSILAQVHNPQDVYIAMGEQSVIIAKSIRALKDSLEPQSSDKGITT